MARRGDPRLQVPTRDIDGIKDADAKLLDTIRALDDDGVRRPSLLPNWSVGHVLTHIARNGDSVVRRLNGCAQDEIVDQYEGGAEGRADEIEAGAARSAAEIIADVEATNAAVQAAIAAMPDDGWDRLSRSVDGGLNPATKLLFSRWREIEVHHVDLGLGYEPGQWPEDLARRWLTTLLPRLPDRTAPQLLLAWLLDRGGPPALSDWE
jgi:maleylpyruvate isomerase